MSKFTYMHNPEGTLRSFVSPLENRYLYIQRDLWSVNIEGLVRVFNEELNLAIQSLNLFNKHMLIPYYRIIPRRADNDSLFARNVCGYLRCKKKGTSKSYYVPYDESDCLIYDSIIDLLLCSDYQMITVSNKFCFKAIGDKSTLRRILTDVLLDDAICNSYFGINGLSDDKLSYLNKCKMQFIRENKLISRYRIDEEDLDKIQSLSFASFCRKGDEINPRKFFNLWESFIEKYFEGQIPVVPSIEEQLKLHEQYEQLPDKLVERIKAKPEGAYLVLRVNKEPKEENKEIIEAIFGLDSSIGKIKVVPISEFFKEDYQMLIRTLAVSAYKVINKQ